MVHGNLRTTILTAAVACLLASATATPAAAQEWGFVEGGANDVRLFYGVPESEDVTLSVICNPRRHRFVIVVSVLPPGAKAGQSIRVTFTAGSSSAAYDAKVVRDRVHGGIYIEASSPADTRIFDLLRSSQSLTVAAGSKQETVPLKDVADPLAKMEKACLGK